MPFLFAILLFSMQTAALQTSHSVVMPPELNLYFKSVNLAARAIYDNDFVRAVGCYEEAFRHKTTPFYSDIKNAIIVNSKCGYFEKNNALLRILMEDKRMDTVQLFRQLPKRLFNPGNLAFIRKQASLPKKKGSFDQNLLQEYIRIYENDQDAVIREPMAKDENSSQFIALYRQRGFPSEEKTGCFVQDTIERWNGIETMMCNFIKHRTADSDTIMQILQKEFEKGNIPPSVLGNCYQCAHQNARLKKLEYNCQNELVATTTRGTQMYRPFVVFTDSLMNLINTNRLVIGLDSFHVAQKQFICGAFCDIPDCTDPNKSTIQTVNYISIPKIPYGFLKMAAEKDNIDLAWYMLDTRSIAFRCNCEKKQY